MSYDNVLVTAFHTERCCMARTMLSQDARLSVCLSVRLSHAGILFCRNG